MPRLFGRKSEFKFKLYLDDTSCRTSNESLITAYVAVRVEIEHYSVVHFDRVIAFKTL